jgi:hypothetical protein
MAVAEPRIPIILHLDCIILHWQFASASRVLRCSCIVVSLEFGLLADEIGVMESKSLTSKEVVPE